MGEIEVLTEEERTAVSLGELWACEKVLSILDAANARVAELEKLNAAANAQADLFAARANSANARADAATDGMDIEQARRETEQRMRERAESEAAALRERLYVEEVAEEDYRPG
jgi:hypothetical protein